MKRPFFVLWLGIAVAAHAQDTEVPHVFQAGTPARAAEVNANFAELTEVVNVHGTALSGLLSAAVPQQIGTVSITAAPYADQEIPIYSIQWSGVVAGGGGGGAAVATFGGMTIGKPFDLFSPQLLTDYAALQSIPAVRIDLTESNSVLTSYILESVHISGLGAITLDGSGMPLETVQFAYEKLTLSTTDPATNTTMDACFDIQGNTSC